MALLRAAFQKAVEDPELRADAERQRLAIDPTWGRKRRTSSNGSIQTPPPVIERTRKIVAVAPEQSAQTQPNADWEREFPFTVSIRSGGVWYRLSTSLSRCAGEWKDMSILIFAASASISGSVATSAKALSHGLDAILMGTSGGNT